MAEYDPPEMYRSIPKYCHIEIRRAMILDAISATPGTAAHAGKRPGLPRVSRVTVQGSNANTNAITRRLGRIECPEHEYLVDDVNDDLEQNNHANIVLARSPSRFGLVSLIEDPSMTLRPNMSAQMPKPMLPIV
jgi:hypothetical protein